MTLAEWAERHASLFGLTGSAHEGMIVAWLHEFEVTGYTADELSAATSAIPTMPEAFRPKYPGDHYAAIVRLVQAERAKQRLEFESQTTHRNADGWATCELCSDAKFVVVPRVENVPEWVDAARFVTCAVVCSCARARFMLDAWDVKARPRPLSLAEYERRVPNWRELLEHERRVRAARAQTAGAMRGPLADVLRETMQRMPRRVTT